MKYKVFWEQLENMMNERKKGIIGRIISNPENYNIYERGKFLSIGEMEEKEKKEFINGLKNNEIKSIIVDNCTKKNIEESDALIKHKKCKWAVFENSTVDGIVTISGERIIVSNSSIEGTSTNLMYDVVIEDGSRVLESTLAVAYLTGATVLGSNVYFTKMEKGSLINWYSFAANGNHIKENVQIGPNCNIMSRTFSYHRPMEYLVKYEEIEEETIEIDEFAWIGANTSIIKGVNIGAWSILAAGSIISNDIKPFYLAVQNKEKSIVERIKVILTDANIIERILKIENIQTAHATGAVYNNVINQILAKDNYSDYLKLFYVFSRSEFVKSQKKVRAQGIEYPFNYNEYMFEFFTPDKIEIDMGKREFILTFNKTYEQIDCYRKEFIEILCSYGKVREGKTGVYTIKIEKREEEMLREIDKIFNKEIINVINSVGISLEECVLEIKEI